MSTQSDFISKIAPIVQKIAPNYNILCCSAVIAQACLESAYGTSGKAQHHNYFGLKYRPGRLTCNTGAFKDGSSEQRADGSRYSISDMWYNFASMEDGVEGYFQFIDIANYSNVKNVRDPQEYLTNIRADGYATSLDYVKNVMAVVTKWNLTQYDPADPEEQRSKKAKIKIIKNTGFKGFNVSKRTVRPKYIVIHYVGAAGSARNNVSYFNGGNRSASADFFVDEEICQYNPDIDRYNTWHCGGSRQTSLGGAFFGQCMNSNSIGIEMCCYKFGKDWLFKDVTVTNTVALVQYLMDFYGIPASRVIRHFDVTGKYCPGVPGWIPPIGGEVKWKLFKARLTGSSSAAVDTGSNETATGSASTSTGGKYMFEVSTVSVGVVGKSALLMQKLLKVGGYKGKDGKVLTLDSSAGTNTIYALRSFQKKAGVTVDGICGPNTWKKLLGI